MKSDVQPIGTDLDPHSAPNEMRGSSILSSLPGIHQKILNRLGELSQNETDFALQTWREGKVDCDTCTLACSNHKSAARSSEEASQDVWPFSKDVKCCTFQPAWANFMVGEWLLAGGATARAQLEVNAWQAQMLPLGILPASLFQAQFAESGETLPFGADLRLRCSHLVDAKCSIWTQRPGTCATYFCQSSHGAIGLARLGKLEKLLNSIELNLAHECLLEFGFTGFELRRNLATWPVGVRRASTAGDILHQVKAVDDHWLEFKDQKIEFYLRCAKMVRAWDPDEILRRLGDDVNLLYRSLRTDQQKGIFHE